MAWSHYLMAEPQTVFEFATRKGTIRYTLSVFRGRVYVNIARWWTPRKGPNKGQLIPVGGVTVDLAQLSRLEVGLRAVRAATRGIRTSDSTRDGDDE